MRETLREAGLLDGPPEADFDQLLRIVAERLDAPVALMSVIDREADRQFFKAALGLGEPWAGRRETPLSHSFCRIVAESDAPLIVPDSRRDARVRDNLAVRDLGVIAYLGAPIEAADGEAIGALCAIDNRPREWTEDDLAVLSAMARAVSSQIKMRLALREADRARAAAEAASAALEESNRRFADLAANAPGAIFRYVSHADGRTEIEYMSPGCAEIWEVGPEAIQGDASVLWTLVLPEDLPDMIRSVAWSAENLTRWRHRWRIRTASGRLKWLQGYGQPQRRADGGALWNSLILDVTVEVEAQEALAESRRMLHEAQKQETVGRLAGGIAHDVNNLLSIVLGAAELLETGPDDAPQLLDEIKTAALRGGELTRRLLSFARRSDLQPVVLDVNAAIAGMHNLFRRTLPATIAVETALMAGLWKVRADAAFFENALLNLVVNARDAMPDGGRLTIETANMRITDAYVTERGEDIAPGRYVMVAVSDTGAGIDPALLDRLFEPFFTTKGPDRGTGLGLAMVQGFAKQSGGTVRVYSELGTGSAFKLYLPALAEGEAAEPAAPDIGADVVSGGVLLLAEDEPSVRAVARAALERGGWTVIEAESGDAALALFEASPDRFDVVVTDVVMPGRLQGPGLVQAIRRLRPAMPAVYVSGYPHEANVHGNGLRAGDMSLTKPVQRDELLHAVARAVRAAR